MRREVKKLRGNSWSVTNGMKALVLVGVLQQGSACGQDPQSYTNAQEQAQTATAAGSPLQPDSSCFGRTILDSYQPHFPGHPAAPPLIDRDAYVVAGNPSPGNRSDPSTKFLVDMGRIYRRVCIIDLKRWGEDDPDINGSLDGWFGRNRAASAQYLGRVYPGFMGRNVLHVPTNLGDADVFFIAPDLDFALGDVAPAVDRLAGLQARVYVVSEFFGDGLRARLRAFPSLRGVDVAHGKDHVTIDIRGEGVLLAVGSSHWNGEPIIAAEYTHVRDAGGSCP